MASILIIFSVLVISFIIKAIIRKDSSHENRLKDEGSLDESVSWEFVKTKLKVIDNKQVICPKCGTESHLLN